MPEDKLARFVEGDSAEEYTPEEFQKMFKPPVPVEEYTLDEFQNKFQPEELDQDEFNKKYGKTFVNNIYTDFTKMFFLSILETWQ